MWRTPHHRNDTNRMNTTVSCQYSGRDYMKVQLRIRSVEILNYIFLHTGLVTSIEADLKVINQDFNFLDCLVFP